MDGAQRVTGVSAHSPAGQAINHSEGLTFNSLSNINVSQTTNYISQKYLHLSEPRSISKMKI